VLVGWRVSSVFEREELAETAPLARTAMVWLLRYVCPLAILAVHFIGPHYFTPTEVAIIEDTAERTLLAVHRARQTYDPGRPFAPWFYAVASSRLIDVVRRERRVTSREIPGDVLPEAPIAGGTATRDEIDVEAIHAAVAALPPRQREVIEALKFQDQSVREVAGRLSMTESAVKVTAHRGYKALKRLLGGHGRED